MSVPEDMERDDDYAKWWRERNPTIPVPPPGLAEKVREGMLEALRREHPDRIVTLKMRPRSADDDPPPPNIPHYPDRPSGSSESTETTERGDG